MSIVYSRVRLDNVLKGNCESLRCSIPGVVGIDNHGKLLYVYQKPSAINASWIACC